MASARAKSRALRAASRSAIAASIATTSSVPPRNQACASRCSRPITCPAARKPARRIEIARQGTVRQRMHRRQRQRRVQIIAQRLHHRCRHIDSRQCPDSAPARDRTGRAHALPPPAPHPRNPASSDNACGSTSSRTASAGAFASTSRTVKKLPSALRHLLAVHLQHAAVHPIAREVAAGKRADALRHARSRGAGRSGRCRRHGCRTSRPDSATTSRCTRCASPAARGPKGCPSQAGRASTASTARNHPDRACTVPHRSARPASSSSGLRPDRCPYALKLGTENST